jgi:hypothetical protein
MAIASPVFSDPLPRGTRAGTMGPNLIADSSFESMDMRAFTLDTPYRAATDPQAHTGKVDVQATCSRSGKSMYTQVGVWKNTDYVSSVWLRGSGTGTLFVATGDLSVRLAATSVTATANWQEVSLPWNSGAQTRVAIGFQDDISKDGTLYLDDFYTGLKDGRTIPFVAPPADEPKPQAPPL